MQSRGVLPHALLPTLVAIYHAFVGVWIVDAEAVETRVGLLLAEEAAERAVPAPTTVVAFIFKPGAVFLEAIVDLGEVLRVISHVALLILVLVGVVYLLTLYIELTQLVHVVYDLVAELHSLFGLLECVLVSMDL